MDALQLIQDRIIRVRCRRGAGGVAAQDAPELVRRPAEGLGERGERTGLTPPGDHVVLDLSHGGERDLRPAGEFHLGQTALGHAFIDSLGDGLPVLSHDPISGQQAARAGAEVSADVIRHATRCRYKSLFSADIGANFEPIVLCYQGTKSIGGSQGPARTKADANRKGAPASGRSPRPSTEPRESTMHREASAAEHPLMTVAEAASALRVSQMTIRRAIYEGTFDAIQIGRAYRVPRAYVNSLIKGKRPTAAHAQAVAE